MHWWYKCVERTDDGYVYAYSRESRALDGLIKYSLADGSAQIIRESDTDCGSARMLERSLTHFELIVREGFPKERHVCCG